MSGRALERVAARGVAVAGRRADRMRKAVVARAEAMGVDAAIVGEDVTLSGRGLLDRWLRDAVFRDVGRAGR